MANTQIHLDGMGNDKARRWQLLAIVVVIGLLVWLLAPVLLPFAIAATFAYLGDPLTNKLEKLGLNRTLAVSVVFLMLTLLLVGALLLLAPLIVHQVQNLIANLPRYVDWMQNTALPRLQVKLHLDPNVFDTSQVLATVREHLGTLGNYATLLLGKLSRSSLGVVEWLTNLLLIPVVTFYLMRDWHSLVNYIHRLLPRSVEPTVVYLARESDAVLGAFVRGQLLVMLGLGLYYGLALSLVAGLSVGPLIGMVAGLLSFVPYLGFITGFASAVIAALVQYGDWTHVLIVCGVFIVGQLLEGYVLVPKLVGGKIGLHPVAVIFAVLAGGDLFGFLGILIALPAAAVVMVMLRYIIERYRMSNLYTGEGPEDPLIAEIDVKVYGEAETHHTGETPAA